MTGGDDLSQTQRIQAAVGGEANIIASSVLYEASNTSPVGCDTVSYLCSGMPLTATQGGLLNFNSSVALPLNAEFFFPGKDSYSEFSSGDLIADPFSYVAATPTQDGNTVQGLFDNGNILTEGDTYDLISDSGLTFFNPLPNGAVPLVDGVLVSVIPDATPGGANQLINPIDGSPITADVFGNPRTNALGFRDIGAVQVLGAADECWEGKRHGRMAMVPRGRQLGDLHDLRVRLLGGRRCSPAGTWMQARSSSPIPSTGS